MNEFMKHEASNETYWRSIILFGRNVATYKFALAASLLDFAKQGQQTVSISELARPFAAHIVEHIKVQPKQGTSGSSKFLDACIQYTQHKLSLDQLHEATVRLGFVNVIDAFHVLGTDQAPVRFFVDERINKRIIITDALLRISDSPQFINLPFEVDARWQLVENAWKLGMNRNLVTVSYDQDQKTFMFNEGAVRRPNLVSARPSLNGYQKGKCFYCLQDINVDNRNQGHSYAAVDHVLPFVLSRHDKVFTDINGVWNLVLTCQTCNSSKSDRIPHIRFIEQLNHRNNFLVDSHHPLRETILYQTGQTREARISFLQNRYNKARELYPTEWKPI